MVFVSVVALLVLSLVTAARGNDVNLDRFLVRSSGKRSDGLMRDLVNLLMEEKRERKDLSDENKAMKKAMKEMKQSLADLTRTCSSRYTDILNQVAGIRNQTDIGEVKWSLAELSGKTSRQFKEIRKQVISTKQSVADLTNKGSSQYTDIQNQIAVIRNQTGTNGSLPRIGFTVMLGGDKTVSGIMVFKYIIANYGGRYNSTTGKFTCNKSGLYMINISILSYTADAQAHIMKNNAEFAFAYTSTSGGGSNSNMESGSVNAVVELDVGDQIWVKTMGSYKCNTLSYFSGALISA